MDKEKVFSEGSERKEALVDHKNIHLKNNQILHFFKGVSSWFLSKNGDFLILCFLQMDLEKDFFEGS